MHVSHSNIHSTLHILLHIPETHSYEQDNILNLPVTTGQDGRLKIF
jgi:hypothetical protein